MISLLSTLASFIFGASLNGNRLKRYIFRTIRSFLIYTGDPLVTMNANGHSLRMPLSHNLPFYCSWYPEYDRALTRISTAVSHLRKRCIAIDIGANIGDSARAILEAPNSYVVCIEGVDIFSALIPENLSGFEERFSIVRANVGTSVGNGKMSIQHGTAQIVQSETMYPLKFTTLTAALESAPAHSCDLLKIDTDGYDVNIILEEHEFLGRHKPIVFFEYYPALIRSSGSRGLSVFDSFKSLGYKGGLSYLNTGELLGRFSLDNFDILCDHLRFRRTHRSIPYLDICVFYNEADLLAVLATENAYFDRTYK